MADAAYDYRPVPEADVEEFRRLVTYAFRPTERPDPLDSEDDLPAPARIGARRGIYEGEELLCTGRHYWFTHRIRGERHAVGGVSAVSTPPKNRRRGLVRRLLAESLAEYRERDHDVASLWPFEYEFYRTFGWATASRTGEARFAPDALDFLDALDAAGRFVDLDADRWADCEAVYRAATDHALSMYRTEEWWRKRVFAGWEDDPYVAGWERDGDLRGYLVYDIDDGDDGRVMTVSEWWGVDTEARLELLRFCRYHDSQVGRVTLHGPVDPTLQDLVRDPEAVTVEVNPGAMVRLVDVERALSALAYPTDAEVTVRLAVEDPLAEWNRGRFHLDVRDGRATCERVTAGADAAAGEGADATLSVGALSQLAVGYRSAGDLARHGRLDADESTVAALETALPREETFLAERF
ncbi:GNAT family N-acetyltransferase [Halomarina ordinaria]|uniref:Enhanced intracellular survival protein Eis n=1 Tax=Halomarina ordinaria TaxID=3033939 RepID=A0ABD5U6E4_9EURY|nr:GNAT family N-acetyltransferase [Halomarina sp. PSRA2]